MLSMNTERINIKYTRKRIFNKRRFILILYSILTITLVTFSIKITMDTLNLKHSEDILSNAYNQADQIISDAENDASNIKYNATVDASKKLEAAQTEAKNIIQKAEDKANSITEVNISPIEFETVTNEATEEIEASLKENDYSNNTLYPVNPNTDFKIWIFGLIL